MSRTTVIKRHDGSVMMQILDLWVLDVMCQNCGDEGQWEQCREWYEDGPANGSGIYGWVCPTCTPLVDAMPVRQLATHPTDRPEGQR